MDRDVCLDDLIKKDKQKSKLNKNKPIKKKVGKDSVKARRNKLNNQSDKKMNNKLSKGNLPIKN